MFRGRIELVIGPMFAGKTTELMRRVKREIHARRSCFVIKYSKDTRYDVNNVASHDQLTLRAQAAVSKLMDVKDQWRKFDVLAVDEGQFFCDLVDFCNTAADAGKIVMVSALDGDYRRKPFGQICELVPYCESVDKLSAVCMMCHEQPACFTRRTVNLEQQELIGGADMYIATCRQCYMKAQIPSFDEMRSRQQAIKEVERSYLGVACKTPEKSAGCVRGEEEGTTSPISAGAVDAVDFKTPRAETTGDFSLHPPPKFPKAEKVQINAFQ